MNQLVEVASMIIGLAILGLIITRSSNTAQVIQAGTSGFSNLIATATFQNSGFAGGMGGIY